jgi:hypothetical protein
MRRPSCKLGVQAPNSEFGPCHDLIRFNAIYSTAIFSYSSDSTRPRRRGTSHFRAGRPTWQSIHLCTALAWNEGKDSRRTGAQRVISHFELLARLEVLAPGINAAKVVAIILPAVSGLILVRKPRIEGGGTQGVFPGEQ